jgi:uncharacterized protein YndB with AHSA1/START domain
MCKTIKHKVRFKASPETIYGLLADSRKRTEFTRSKAVMSDKVGGMFSTDAGQVTGVNVDLVPGRRLVQAWRRKDFPDGVYSMAAITLDPIPGGGTQLVLTHRGVPKQLLDDIEEYWRHVCWAPMKAVTTTAPVRADQRRLTMSPRSDV